LTPNPILKVLSTLRKCDAPALLMGGQACILYGGAEFSRDIDLAIPCSVEGLDSIRMVLAELKAEPVYVPSLEPGYLEKGHACHFRCGHPEAAGLRIDVLSRMRGCAEFPTLWARRAEFAVPEVGTVASLCLADLVQSKKTQRDKDWPMIRRLLEADYLNRQETALPEDIRWWLTEMRTPAILLELLREHPDVARQVSTRPWLLEAGSDEDTLAARLETEERAVRQADREYWAPLKRELQVLRRKY
jgi:hypothetical protein